MGASKSNHYSGVRFRFHKFYGNSAGLSEVSHFKEVFIIAGFHCIKYNYLDIKIVRSGTVTDWSNLTWLMHQWLSKVQTSSYGNVAMISDKVMIVKQTTNGPSLIITTQTFVDFLLTDLFLLKLPLFIEEPLALNIKKLHKNSRWITQKISLFFFKYVIPKSAWWESCSKQKCSQNNVSKEIRQLVT